MSNLPRISVAIATLDRPQGLRRCLEAIVTGSVLPDEILVVDQGDHQKTEEVLNAMASPVPIRHERLASRGLSASRNAAFERARADIIAVTDDDCRPDRGWVEAIVSVFGADSQVGAVCGRVLADGTDEDGVPASLRPSTTRRVFDGPVTPWEVGTGGNFAVRRDLLVRSGGYDERLGAGSPGRAAEDLDVIRRLLRGGTRIAFEPDALILHARKPPADERGATRGYGYGIGAMCGISVARGDIGMLRVLWEWLVMRLRLAVTLTGGARGEPRLDEGRVMTATIRGFLYGVTRRRHRRSAVEMEINDPDGLRAQVRHSPWRRRSVRLRQYRRRLRRPAALSVRRSLTPASDVWGYDRGTPVDRYYIRRFVAANRGDISGRTLEVKDSYYSGWAGSGVAKADILDLDPSNEEATLIADLGRPDALPEATFDCFILTQTLHLIPDLPEALRNAHRCLRPGGVLLATVPTVSRIVEEVGVDGDYWRLTPAAARRVFGDAFGPENIQIHTEGNLLSTTAFLSGLACEELSRKQLDHRDDRFPLIVGVRAVRAW